jgi:methylglutaconyl-CoA hydratase
MTDLVRSQAATGVTTITLDSPASRNALSTALLTQLRTALAGALAAADCRVIVLTGAGTVFCAGADLKEARSGRAAAPELFPEVLRLVWDSPKPVICRVNGAARAGGIGLIAASDIAIAPVPATFAFTEVRIGVVPAIISVPCLRRMPPRAAAEYFLTGEVFDAARATEIGLLTRVVEAAELDAEVQRYARMLLAGAPGALAAAKDVLREVPALPFAAGLARMAELSASGFASAEAREGMAAFAERRPPGWAPQP